MNCDRLTEDLKEVRVSNVDACFSVSGRRTNNNQKLLECILGRAMTLVQKKQSELEWQEMGLVELQSGQITKRLQVTVRILAIE